MAIFVTPVGSSLLLGSTALPRADGAESTRWLAKRAREMALLDGTGWWLQHTVSEQEQG